MNKLLTSSLPIGKWIGIPVYLHWTWLAALLVSLIYSWQFAIVFVAVFFIILLHELGHCIAAKSYNIDTRSIYLTPLGGMASLELTRWVDPLQELVISLAGPVVNMLLFLPLVMLANYVGGNILMLIAAYNLMILLFNLIPCFPMDGGRILRSVLSMSFGKKNGTYWAVRVGQVIGVLFIIAGFTFGQYALPLIGFLAIIYAENEWQNAKMESVITEAYRKLPHDMSEQDKLKVVADALKSNEPWMYKIKRLDQESKSRQNG